MRNFDQSNTLPEFDLDLLPTDRLDITEILLKTP